MARVGAASQAPGTLNSELQQGCPQALTQMQVSALPMASQSFSWGLKWDGACHSAHGEPPHGDPRVLPHGPLGLGTPMALSYESSGLWTLDLPRAPSHRGPTCAVQIQCDLTPSPV